MKGKKRALFAMLKEGGRPELAAALLFAQVLCTVRDVACLVTLVDATDCLLYGGENLTAALVWMAAAMFAGTPVSMLMKYLSGRYRIQLQCALTEKLSGRLEETELSKIRRFVAERLKPEQHEELPYHDYGAGKYQMLGMKAETFGS